MVELTQAFVASLSDTIQSADIPCVLWGHCLLYAHGIPSILGSIDFVVPDRLLEAASKVLQSTSDLKACEDIQSCVAGPNDRCTPPAAFHMHIIGSEVTVGLYPHSDTLWFLPPLEQSLAHPVAMKEHPYFVLASDKTVLPPNRPGRGSGAFESSDPPVLVLRPAVLLEASMRLYARDAWKQIGDCSMAMIDYVELYVDADGYLDDSELPEPLRTFYRLLKEDKMTVRQWTLDLQDALGVQREAGEAGDD